MAGGGTTGKVGFPTYMENVHKFSIAREDAPTDAFDKTLVEVVNEMFTSNPFTGQSFTDPATDFADTETRFDAMDSIVTAIDPTTDWDTFVDIVASKLDETGILPDVDIDTVFTNARAETTLETREAIAASLEAINDIVVRSAVRSFERRSDHTRRGAVNRFAGQMSDINAVQSSAFIFGMAILESQHLQRVAEFDTTLSTGLYQGAFTAHMTAFQNNVRARLTGEMQNKQVRDQTAFQSVGLLTQFVLNQAEIDHAVTRTKAEINRIKIAGTQEYEGASFDLADREVNWDMDVFHKEVRFLGGLGGGTALPAGPSKAQSAIGGAIGGAVAGNAVPGIGTAVGAVAGLAAGLL